MHQHLTLPTPLVVIGNHQVGRQTIRVQRDAVNRIKRIRPLCPGVLAQARRAQSKVQLNRQIRRRRRHRSGSAGGRRSKGRGGGSGRRFRSGLAQELPPRRAGEAVLGEILGLSVVGGCSEDLLFPFLVSIMSSVLPSFEMNR